MSILKTLQMFIDEANLTNSMNDKKAVIAKYPELKMLFKYIYDDMVQFNVTSDNIKKRGEDIDPSMGNDYSTIFDLLNALASRKVTGHSAISSVKKFIDNNSQYEEIIYRIIDKNLKTRADTSLINKVFPDTIPTFDVALASNYENKKKKVYFLKDIWFWSRKLDGCRCITFIYANGDVECFSRSGKRFLTLQKVIDDVKKLGLENMVLDGEICITDAAGNESFDGIIKLIKRKDFTIESPKYKLFDILPMEDFRKKEGDTVFHDRYVQLKTLISTSKTPTLDVLTQTRIKSEADFEAAREEARKNNWEGLIIRKNMGYEGKRSDGMLKVKDFFDAEYEVIGTENGLIRVIDNGAEVEKMMTSNLVIEHKGNKVGVGSGLSMDQRMEWYKDPSKIIGKIITVKYFETTLVDGVESLRFPILKNVFEGERDI